MDVELCLQYNNHMAQTAPKKDARSLDHKTLAERKRSFQAVLPHAGPSK